MLRRLLMTFGLSYLMKRLAGGRRPGVRRY
ncbi:hypothetical protein GGQ97_001031 [Sphingomonas kaistensis]|uniref:Uncharacterized protein n=1 Tax=Sphingomonas kaistensis TaxID=298708 RepID=A0A7X5Y5Q2_9SPHN|nr:hypothetical protein [Sphingomonas kaistensis]